jgi:hypothetical protein
MSISKRQLTVMQSGDARWLRPGSPLLRFLRVAVVIVIAALLASCGSPSKSGSGTTSSSSLSSTAASESGGTTTTTYYPQGHNAPPPVTPTTRPYEYGEVPVAQTIQSGNTILIEPNGFWPQTLYANEAVPITWYNLSGHSQVVAFDHIPVGSKTIPPGWKFVWKSRFAGSLTYHSASGFHALLVLQAQTPISYPTTTTTS